jgi:hypothetical protein
MVEIISTTALHNNAKKPTMKEIEKDFLKKISELPAKKRNSIDVKSSILQSVLRMKDHPMDDEVEQYFHKIHLWECEYNTKVFNPKKLRNNNQDIFTSVHNYIIDNKTHYPIYKLNGVFEMFYKKSFANCVYENSIMKSSKYKTFNREVYMVFIVLNAIGIIDYPSIINISKNKRIQLYPFQARYKALHRSKLEYYEIRETIDLSKYMDDDICWKYILTDEACIRVKPYKICIVESETNLPHQDIMVSIFLKDLTKYYDITIDKTKSYFGFFKAECISKKDYNNHPIFDGKIDMTTPQQQDRMDLMGNVLHTHYIYRQRAHLKKYYVYHPRYKITDKVINLFNQKSYTNKFLENIFNPKKFTEPSICNKFLDVLVDDNDSDTDNNEPIDELPIDDDKSFDYTFLKVYKQTFNFNYNRHYDFNDEKTIIETAIYKLIEINEKANNLFNIYTDINVLKSIGKCYTNKRYFNIILYNKDTKLVSQSYHAYLDDMNSITSITRIENLI